jgi:Xaa-Pro aminopeptidase
MARRPRPPAEVREKLARIRRLLAAERLDGVLLSTRAAFAWITGGGTNRVAAQRETGAARVLVTRRSAALVSDAIEMPRLVAEEPVGWLRPRVLPWFADERAVRRTLRGQRLASDDGAFGLRRLGPSLAGLQTPLTAPEVARYRGLGRDAARAVEAVAFGLRPGMRERDVAGELARALLVRGAEPHVLLVGSDERLARFRHPIPSEKRIARTVMLVVCAERHGLIANLTRLVHFGRPSRDLLARHAAVVGVEAALWAATRPGVAWAEALRAGIAAYARAGFAGEWRRHHQGGPTGYAARDFLATPREGRRIALGQAVAWNPSIAGTKSEDTVLVTPRGLEVLTEASARWPRLDVAFGRGRTLARPAILVRRD